MQHEAMHSLGFHHEHVRPDRDSHVEIHPDVVNDFNYIKLPAHEWVDLSSPFDHDSIMLYPANPMGGGTWLLSVPGSNYKQKAVSNRVYPFSVEDINQINTAYCSGKAQEKTLLLKMV